MQKFSVRVLFIWEFGGAHGHLGRLVPVIRALQASGCDVLLACRHLDGLPADLDGVTVVPAPAGSAVVGDAIPEPASFADILYNDGLCEPGALRGRLLAWRGLFERLQPDLVVLDYSPYAALASRLMTCPVALLGTGFACPPDVQPLPDIRRYQNHYPERLALTERQVLVTINQVMDELGVPKLERLGAMFNHVTVNLVASCPELDHYSGCRLNRQQVPAYCGAWGEVAGEQPVWPDIPGPRLFAYLKHTRLTPYLLKSLEARALPTLVYASGMPDAERYCSSTMTVSALPFDMAQVAMDAQLAICHAGLTTTDTLLHAGIPQLLLPINIEQFLTAQNMAAIGAAVYRVMESREALDDGLDQLLADAESLRSAARRFATQSPFGHRAENLENAVRELHALLPAPSN